MTGSFSARGRSALLTKEGPVPYAQITSDDDDEEDEEDGEDEEGEEDEEEDEDETQEDVEEDKQIGLGVSTDEKNSITNKMGMYLNYRNLKLI